MVGGDVRKGNELPARDGQGVPVRKQGVGVVELRTYSLNKHLLSSRSLQISAVGTGETKGTESQARLVCLRQDGGRDVPRD